MIAQDIAGSVVFSKERCSGSYTRLRKNRWTFNGKARARAIYELSVWAWHRSSVLKERRIGGDPTIGASIVFLVLVWQMQTGGSLVASYATYQ